MRLQDLWRLAGGGSRGTRGVPVIIRALLSPRGAAGSRWERHRRHAALAAACTLVFGTEGGVRSEADLAICVRANGLPVLAEDSVCIQNLGEAPGAGLVTVAIVDLLSGRTVALDSAASEAKLAPGRLGGNAGIVVHVASSPATRRVLEAYEATRQPYLIRGDVIALGDVSLANNAATVERFMTPVALRDTARVLAYNLRNQTDRAVRGRLVLRASTVANGWSLDSVSGSWAVLDAGRSLEGAVLARRARSSRGMTSQGVTLSLVGESGDVIAQRAWHLVVDSTPPMIENLRVVILSDGRVLIQMVVGDFGAGMGLRGAAVVRYSTGGRPWHAALPRTTFHGARSVVCETEIGPFAKGTSVALDVTAWDVVGNVQRAGPSVASVIAAPVGLERFAKGDAKLLPGLGSDIFEIEALMSVVRTSDTLLVKRASVVRQSNRGSRVAAERVRARDVDLVRSRLDSLGLDLADARIEVRRLESYAGTGSPRVLLLQVK